ncbi:MAG TPA: hypothetical protein VMR31_07665 [Myxococcota bacterium]|nr:hypothetical protein [Myxococcota bacterium]
MDLERLARIRWRRELAAIVAVALALRVAYAWTRPEALGSFRDAWHYVAIAQSLVARGEYADTVGLSQGRPLFSDVGPTSFWLPGYPLLVAGVSLVFGPGVRKLLVTNALLGTLTVLFCGLAARRLAGRRAALWSAGLVAVNVSQIYFGGLVGIETLVGTCLAAALWGFAEARAAWGGEPNSLGRWGAPTLLGVALAAGALTRTVFLPISGVLLAALAARVLARGGGAWRAVAACAPPALLVACALVPWLARNAARFGEPVYESKVGFNMVIGFNDHADGGFALTGVPDLDASRYDERARDRIYRDMATDWIRRHPVRAVALGGEKLARIWNPVPVWEHGPSAWAFATWSIGLLALTALGAALALRTRLEARIVIWVALAYLIPITLAFAVTRFRAPLEPALAILAGAGAEWLVGQAGLTRPAPEALR